MPRLVGWTRPLAVAGVLAMPCVLAGAAAPLRFVAHTGLKRSEPAKNSRLSVAPARISLWFTARPQLVLSRIRLTGPSGAIPLGPIVADTGYSLHASIPRTLGPGDYRVQWQTASADGHPIRGEFTFAVIGQTAEAAVPSAPNESAHASHQQAAAAEAPRDHSEYRSARWLEFVALLTVLGVLAFRHGVLPPLAARGVPTADAADRARRLGQNVLVVYAIAAVVRLYTESVALHGAEEALGAGVLMPLLTATVWGVGWILGVVGAMLLLIGWLVSKRSVAIGTPLALTGALGMVLSPALSGHAAASRHFVLSVTLDMLHVVAAGVWLGGLLMVLVAGVPAMRRLTNGNQDAAVSALVNSFHPLALFCAPIVVIAGLGTSWTRLGGFGAVWSTEYGRTLLLKVGLVALVAGMGLYNSLRARRRLGSPEGTRRFRATGAIEIAVAALVVVATTFLVGTPVPSDMVSP
ncbi:MAG: copper resistance protein CopC [Gemmatimonadaceae bacterium]